MEFFQGSSSKKQNGTREEHNSRRELKEIIGSFNLKPLFANFYLFSQNSKQLVCAYVCESVISFESVLQTKVFFCAILYFPLNKTLIRSSKPTCWL